MAQLPKRQRAAGSRSGRRRRSRAFPILGFVFTAICLAWFFESQATTTVIFVRHADIDSPESAESQAPLNASGQARAQHLADFLVDVDVIAGVDVIYASERLHTQQTAAPLAERLGVPVLIEDPYQYEPFMEDMLREHKGDIVLIVTHADAIAPLIDELHGSKNLPEIGPNEYDNIYVVTIPWFGKVKTLRFRYGMGLDFQAAAASFEADGSATSLLPQQGDFTPAAQ